MNIKNDVKNAIGEFGELAYQRFFVDFDGNKCVFEDNDHFFTVLTAELKPLQELFAHDVKFYGADAFLMWEFHSVEWCDYESNDEVLNTTRRLRRKNSAAMKFDIDRAIAGDVVEIMVDGEWKTCSIFECDNKTFSATAGDYWTGGSVINDADFLRMKFPKKAAI